MGWFIRKEGTRNCVSKSRVSLENKKPPLPKGGSGIEAPPPPRQLFKNGNDSELIKEYLKRKMLEDLKEDRIDDFQKGKIEVYKDLLKFIDTL